MKNIKKLYEKVAADNALQEKFNEIITAAEKDGKESTEAKLVAFAKEAGFDVTPEEMIDFFRELTERKEGELSGAELDALAGGFINCTSVLRYGPGCAVPTSIVRNLVTDECIKR